MSSIHFVRLLDLRQHSLKHEKKFLRLGGNLLQEKSFNLRHSLKNSPATGVFDLKIPGENVVDVTNI